MKQRRAKDRRGPRSFLGAYLVILAALMALSAGALRYVHRSLEEYEASQPENILAARMEELRRTGDAAAFEQVFSLERMRNEWNATDEQVEQFRQAVLGGSVTFQEDHSGVDPSKKTYDVLLDGVKMATATMTHEGQESRLLIFTLDRWRLEPMEVTGYQLRLTAPTAATVRYNGQVLQGTAADGMTTYDIHSLTPPDVELCDILGNSVPYDQEDLPSFTDYKITIPSNYTIMGAQAVPVELATLEPIEELKYVREYCPEVPDNATYILSILSGTPAFKILDPSGAEVAYTVEDRTVTVSAEFSGQEELSIPVDIDPLEVAKLWSLLMTQDLTGANNGYGQISPYLIQGSYLQEVAWKWVTGQDITFTSSHTLKNPPFQVETVSNYMVYAENCFSCDIRLEKTLVLTRTGEEVPDVTNSRFYFVKYDDTDNGVDDPHWVLADYREIL